MVNVRERLRTLLASLRARLIDNWKHSWKFGSVQLHGLATALAVYMADNPGALRDLVAQLPAQFRLPALIGAGALWFVVGWLVRVWRGVNHAR